MIERMMNMNKKPFSKSTVNAARYESYIVAILLFVFVWFGKDVSAIAILASLSWGGYRLVQNFYIWMAKNEHIMDKKLEYKKLGLDSLNLDEEDYKLDSQEFDDYNV
jgi:predicted PolB exonuclease-like 3'-5' exonuclease